jgi:hypothetical protein
VRWRRRRVTRATAFVVGHEMAHHDLGHMDLIPAWMPRFAHAKGGRLAVVAMAAVERRLWMSAE